MNKREQLTEGEALVQSDAVWRRQNNNNNFKKAGSAVMNVYLQSEGLPLGTFITALHTNYSLQP